MTAPPPEGALGFGSVLVIERSTLEGRGVPRAELFALEDDVLPTRTVSRETEMLWLFYDETPGELDLEEGVHDPANHETGALAPSRALRISGTEPEWEELDADAWPEWVRPFFLRLPCRTVVQTRKHTFADRLSEFQPNDGRLPAMTLLVALDDTRALVASAVGRFYRLDWPPGGALILTPVETATTNYHLGGFKSGDVLYLGGTGTRVAKAPVAPLLTDTPRLEFGEELVLADRPDTIDHAVVSISGDPSGVTDLFFMTESTEVYHLGPSGTKALGAMDARRPPFIAEVDRELRPRQVAWVGAGEAVAAWFHDGQSVGEPGPVLVSAGGIHTPLSFPSLTDDILAFSSSAVFRAEHGLFAARTTFEGGGLRSEIFRKATPAAEWVSFALVDYAVVDMVPSRSAVFATGGYFFAGNWFGTVMRAQRGFRFQDVTEADRCLGLRPHGRQRLVIRLGPKRMVSTGTTGKLDPEWIFTHEE
jgi:hypothetical protein